MSERILRQHIPTFVERGDDPVREARVSSRDDVLRVPWVKAWTDAADDALWCVSDGGAFDGALRVLMIDGYRDGERWWWVVGYFDAAVDWFPRCPGPKGRPARPGGSADARE